MLRLTPCCFNKNKLHNTRQSPLLVKTFRVSAGSCVPPSFSTTFHHNPPTIRSFSLQSQQNPPITTRVLEFLATQPYKVEETKVVEEMKQNILKIEQKFVTDPNLKKIESKKLNQLGQQLLASKNPRQFLRRGKSLLQFCEMLLADHLSLRADHESLEKKLEQETEARETLKTQLEQETEARATLQKKLEQERALPFARQFVDFFLEVLKYKDRARVVRKTELYRWAQCQSLKPFFSGQEHSIERETLYSLFNQGSEIKTLVMKLNNKEITVNEFRTELKPKFDSLMLEFHPKASESFEKSYELANKLFRISPKTFEAFLRIKHKANATFHPDANAIILQSLEPEFFQKFSDPDLNFGFKEVEPFLEEIVNLGQELKEGKIKKSGSPIVVPK